jgi:hypothetical protein
MIRLDRAANLADARMSAAIGKPAGIPIAEQREAGDLIPALSGLPLDAKEVLGYAKWVTDHSAGLVDDGLDLREVMLALVVRTILTTELALQDGR